MYSSFVFLTLIGSFLGVHYLKEQRHWRILVILSIILQLSIIGLLRTRTIYFSCLVSLLVYILLLFLKIKNISPRRILLLSVTLSIIATFFLVGILPKIFEWYTTLSIQSNNIEYISDTGTLSERVLVWNKTFELIKDNLFFGVGIGNWKVTIGQYSLPEIYKVQDLNVIFQRPHNEFIRLLSEGGVLGFFLFVFLL